MKTSFECLTRDSVSSVGGIIIYPQKNTRCVPLLERMLIELMISKAEKQELHSRVMWRDTVALDK